MMNGMMGMGLWMVGSALSWVAVLALVVAATVWLIRSMIKPAPKTDSAESILRDRYASGELSPEEFHQRLADLGRSRG